MTSVARGSLIKGVSTSCGCSRKGVAKKHNKYDLSGEYGIGWTSNTNKEFYFDLEDYEKIKKYCWYENDNGYIVTQQERKTVRLHRLVMDVTDPKIQIDHIFHDTRDNRKKYLREATNMENSWNKKVLGVYYCSEKKKYVANLTYKGNKIFKYFDTFEEARKYRTFLEDKYYKDFKYKEKDKG